jgi:hypothetical protein
MEYGPKAIADGSDLEAREQIMWAATLALNGGCSPEKAASVSGPHDRSHGLVFSRHHPRRRAGHHQPGVDALRRESQHREVREVRRADLRLEGEGR